MLSKCSINISNGIPLLFSQSCGISAVPSEEQPPQIGHLPAHECEQFRVAHPLTSDGESLSTRKD